MRDDMSQVDSYLERQKIDASLIYDVKAFRERYETEAEVQERIAMPDMLYYGKEILEMSHKEYFFLLPHCPYLHEKKIFYFPVQRQQEKIFFVRHFPGCLGGPPMIFLFM